MNWVTAYLPLAVLLLSVFVLLFSTSSNLGQQILNLKDFQTGIRRSSRKPIKAHLRHFTVRRILVYLLLLHLILFFSVYQVLQLRVENLLAEKEIEKVRVQSLIIPYMAFFKSDYIANTGFKYAKKRTRAKIRVQGNLWSEFTLNINEIELARINKLVGKRFVFTFMTSIKKLTPEIHRHMKRELASKEIDAYELEKFDNRGPYMVVVLSEKNRAKDHAQIATKIAERLHRELTVVKKLAVNYVVVKIVDPALYIENKRIKVIARGTAGVYQ